MELKKVVSLGLVESELIYSRLISNVNFNIDLREEIQVHETSEFTLKQETTDTDACPFAN